MILDKTNAAFAVLLECFESNGRVSDRAGMFPIIVLPRAVCETCQTLSKISQSPFVSKCHISHIYISYISNALYWNCMRIRNTLYSTYAWHVFHNAFVNFTLSSCNFAQVSRWVYLDWFNKRHENNPIKMKSFQSLFFSSFMSSETADLIDAAFLLFRFVYFELFVNKFLVHQKSVLLLLQSLNRVNENHCAANDGGADTAKRRQKGKWTKRRSNNGRLLSFFHSNCPFGLSFCVIHILLMHSALILPRTATTVPLFTQDENRDRWST